VSAGQITVELDRGLVRGVVVDDRPQPAPAAPVGRTLLELADRHPDATIVWHEHDAASRLTDPATWHALVDGPHQVRSAGSLHRDDPWLATVGAADFDSALQLPPPTDRPFGSWLLSPIAGVVAASVLIAAGAPPDDIATAAWFVVFGRRAYLSGALLWSDPRLVHPEHREDRVPVHDAGSIAEVVRHGFGRRFLPTWVAAQPDLRRAVAAAAELPRVGRQPDRGRPPAPMPWADPEPGSHPPAIDVVIPTLDRRALLLDTLGDLAQQTHLPASVVVVEQTGGRPAGLPIDGSHLPFPFEHVIIDELGAGNARNLGIARGTSPWLLLLDDDVRFAPDMLDRLWGRLRESRAGAITARLDQVHDEGDGLSEGPVLHMWQGFGSGCALVERAMLDQLGGFDRRIDGGFGEDTELGVRLRQAGAMVVLTTDPHIDHLKAPTGGMRAPYPHLWRPDPARPRPSPTVLLARRSFETPSMAAGYRMHWWLDAVRADGRHFRLRRRLREWRSAHRWTDVLEQTATPEQARRIGPGPGTAPVGPER
jgi:GT2 family glycosyltransferase